MSPRRIVAGEEGLVLLAVMTAVLILTILIGALVLASMDERTIVRQQQSGQQALFLAEAGAYRALAELRHRLTADLDLAIAQAGPEDLRALCRGEAGRIALLTSRRTGDAWEVDPATGEAVLDLNGGEPVAVLDARGEALGHFRALIRVRSVAEGPTSCATEDAADQPGSAWSLTYAVEAVGITPRARRAIRLTNPADAPVVLRLERAAVSRWALLVLTRSRAWLGDGTVIAGPAHANAPWWLAGHPAFRGPASSTAGVIHFENCGTPVDRAARETAGAGTCPGDRPAFADGDLRLAAARVGLQTNPPNLTRAVLGLRPFGPPLAAGDIRRAVAAGGRSDIERGLYVARDGDALRHPETGGASGIYIRGDVEVFALAVEQDRQVISLEIAGGGPWRVSLDPEAETMTVEGPAGQATFRGAGSGLIYVDGSIRSLAGTLHRATRLTVAARGTIIITGPIVHAGAAAGDPTAGLFGLYSELGDVFVEGSAVSGDLQIDAAVAAPLGRFGVRRAAELPERGVLRISGAIAAGELAPIGGFDRRAGGYRGYRVELRYDWRLAGQAPAYFPLTDRFMLSWPLPNPLYRKPLWEEIPVP